MKTFETVFVIVLLIVAVAAVTLLFNGGFNQLPWAQGNEILATFETVCAPIPTGYSGAKFAATYYLKSPGLLDAFSKEVYARGLDSVYDVVYAPVGTK